MTFTILKELPQDSIRFLMDGPSSAQTHPNILIADDDIDYQLLILNALDKAGIAGRTLCLEDGRSTLDYLMRTGPYSDIEGPRPELLIIDLQMPGLIGTEVLNRIRNVPELSRLAVAVLTASGATADSDAAYSLGAFAFMQKPDNFDSLVRYMSYLRHVGDKLMETADGRPDLPPMQSMKSMRNHQPGRRMSMRNRDFRRRSRGRYS